MGRKVFMVACEASGDAHGAHLIHELKTLEPGIELKGVGGQRMEAAGMTLSEDMTRMSALGFGDVVRQYFKYREIFYRTIRQINEWQPDAVFVIDSPAFNLRLAKKISKNFPVVYYISPQIWAWAGSRIHTIKKHVSKMLVILPFETAVYEKVNMPCDFVGHPLLDQIKAPENRAEIRQKLNIPEGVTAIGLFPGSRKREVDRIFPVMLRSASLLKERMPDLKFFYYKASNVPDENYESFLKDFPQLNAAHPRMSFHELVHAMDFALVASGTATLETALLGTPFFLLYKTSWSTYLLGKYLIRVSYLGLVNLLANKRVVPEFIQNDAKPRTIAHEAEVLLTNPSLYNSMKEEFADIREKLGTRGASRKAASSLLDFLNERKK